MYSLLVFATPLASFKRLMGVCKRKEDLNYIHKNKFKKKNKKRVEPMQEFFLNMVNRGKMSLNVTASLVFDRAFLYKVGLFLISFERLKLHVTV